MTHKQKLELTWIGKDVHPVLEPRILIEDPKKSYGDAHSENMLIHGDNLLALKALEQKFAGRIKCIYIDPPYNTGNAFEHYDDALEHSIWLTLMRNRLIMLRRLLSADGFFCCHIDDSEGSYLKVLLDEVFGRTNYLATFFVQVRYPEKTLKQDMAFHKEIEQIHIYRRDYGATPNQNEVSSSFDKFRYYITERTDGKRITLGGKEVIVFQPDEYLIEEREGSADGLKEIWASGTILDGNSSGRFFRDYLSSRAEIDGLGVLYKVPAIGDDKFNYRYFTGPKRAGATKGKYFQGVPVRQLENPDERQFSPIENFYDFAAQFGNCRNEGNVEFRGGKKPELLLHTILKHFSNPGDWVLDSFLGSGTSAAVAHKMGRKWIGIELGDHCDTHCLPRLKKVCDGTDQGGISKAVAWQGGGGFKYYDLAPSLLKQDQHGNFVISDEYNADMLAAAMAKQEGFTYAPSQERYWKQGYSTEQDFIFTTTNHVTQAMIDLIAEELAEGEHLLICCRKFSAGCDKRNLNIQVKKIPAMLMGRCEFGKEDYSLNIVNLTDEASAPEFVPEGPKEKEQNASSSRTRGNKNPNQMELF